MAVNPLADRVRTERLRRGWSVRKASAAGNLSNTWWTRFEDGQQPLTDGIAEGVARAFGWPEDWASQTGDPIAELRADVAKLVEDVAVIKERLGIANPMQFGLAAEGAPGAPPADGGRRVSRPRPDPED